MDRTCVVTGAASGIGAATARHFTQRGWRVIRCDLRDADVIADLATAEGRKALVEGVTRVSGGRIDAIVANAGGGPPETSLSLNFFGAAATLEGLRPLLANSPAPRAVAVSSIAALGPALPGVVDACLEMDEPAAIEAAWKAIDAGPAQGRANPLPDSVQTPLDLYATAKRALQLWCRKAAVGPNWAGAGIPLNVVALGVFDTPAAAALLSNADSRAAVGRMAPLRGAYPGRPEEAAAALAWCVGVENSQMTGQILFVDAGAECLLRQGDSRDG